LQTELNGLKWRKFVAQTSIHRGSSTDIDHDQILRAYGRCLNDGMLCVWRRSMSGVQQNSNRVDIRLDADKELWVFWMNNTDEPDNLAKYTKTLNGLLIFIVCNDAIKYDLQHRMMVAIRA
jgi:hypothetical protein